MTDVPTMDEVLRDAPKNWGKWGEEDEVGALNYLTTEEVFAGCATSSPAPCSLCSG